MTESKFVSKNKNLCITHSNNQDANNGLNDLNRVYSYDKRQELLNILHSEEPDHYQRLYLVGFLKHVGYSQEEICDIIDNEASWTDYNAVMTFNQVRSVFKGEGRNMDISLLVVSSQLLYSSNKEARRETKPYCTLKYTPCSKCPEKCTIQTLGRLK